VLRSDDRVQRIAFGQADQYQQEVVAFCAGVRSAKLPYPAEDGLANMRIVDAVRRQLASNVGK
jgi:predicted dehydrogenase